MECLVYNNIKNKIFSDKKISEIVVFILKKIKKDATVSVSLIGDCRMKKLNKKYRNKDKTTDVLSFASSDVNWSNSFMKKDLGDIFISVPQIKKQAKEFNVSAKEELARMLVHAILHLLGFEHTKEKDAKKMFDLQEKIILDIKKKYV